MCRKEFGEQRSYFRLRCLVGLIWSINAQKMVGSFPMGHFLRILPATLLLKFLHCGCTSAGCTLRFGLLFLLLIISSYKSGLNHN